MPKQLKKMDLEQRELLSLAHSYKYKCHKEKHEGEAYDFHKYRRLKKQVEELERTSSTTGPSLATWSVILNSVRRCWRLLDN